MSGTAGRVARAAAVTAAVAGAAAVSAGGLAAYFTRRVVTPDHVKPDDVEVVAVDLGADPASVTLRRTPETQVEGRYGLWWDDRRGHARLGGVLELDDDTVVRRLEQVEHGELRPGPARWNQYYFSGPPAQSLGLDYQDVDLDTDLGPMPAWFVPAGPADGQPPTSTWAVLVHGRGATREECLRAVPPLHALGLPVLVPSYRNDLGAPSDPSGRYHLGDSEWRDVEAAVLYAVAQGAQDVVLLGWSMGGAIVLQAATRSWVCDRVRAVVLDAPVVDWHAVLDHQSRANRLPAVVTRFGHQLMRNSWGRRLIGLKHPLDLRRLDWVSRAAELQLPILLIHSDDDEFVPNGPSLALAAARPDLITVVPWQVARHTKEWNTDPQRWDRVVSEFVLEQLASPKAVAVSS
ncbi:alpha/beta hydrolase [Angustibacter sp. McL0619]|uniref:alpha/beta hydrolase n=1 Tax=Angustibacter sp. McL0619 TaxID=3415676 RepID=UPI003CF57313